MSVDIPEGFKPRGFGGKFVNLNGPLYTKIEGETVLVGLRVEERHCNPRNIMHGGMIATFADMLLPVSSSLHPDIGKRFMSTVSLNIDYLSPIPLGAWIEGRGEILKVTKRMLFTQGLIKADGVPAARVSGVFKLGEYYDEAERKRRLES